MSSSSRSAGTSVVRTAGSPRSPSIDRRVGGIPLTPSADGTTPRTWCTLIAPASKPTPSRPCTAATPAPGVADGGDGVVPVRLEVGDPAAQRPGVVLAQRLDVAHLEAGPLHRQHRVADVDQLAVGEHVATDERRAARGVAADRADGVVEQPATRREQRRAGSRSSDRGSPGRRAPPSRSTRPRRTARRRAGGSPASGSRRDRPPCLGDAPAGVVRLRLADRDADDGDVVMGRRVDRHRAPAAPDVEQARTGVLGQPELAADQLVLGGLGRVRSVSGSAKRAHE